MTTYGVRWGLSRFLRRAMWHDFLAVVFHGLEARTTEIGTVPLCVPTWRTTEMAARSICLRWGPRALN